METKRPKVSVIIPVYNTQNYVREALTSVMSQTLHEIEIIVINDGSTDNSLNIISSLALEDKRIQVYNQENQGQSVARNHGIEYAKGEYIYFMDSDDIIVTECLKECYKKCKEGELDFVFFNAKVINECPDSPFQMDYHHFGIENRVYNGLDILNFLIDSWQLKIPPYLNLIRKSYLEEIELKFYPGIIHEDQLFTILLYIEAQRVSYINKDFFIRRIRSGSTMTLRMSWRNVVGYFTVFDQLQKYAIGKEPTIQNTINKHINITLNAFIYNTSITKFKNRIELLALCIRKRYIKYLKFSNILRLIFPYKRLLQRKTIKNII